MSFKKGSRHPRRFEQAQLKALAIPHIILSFFSAKRKVRAYIRAVRLVDLSAQGIVVAIDCFQWNRVQ